MSIVTLDIEYPHPSTINIYYFGGGVALLIDWYYCSRNDIPDVGFDQLDATII